MWAKIEWNGAANSLGNPFTKGVSKGENESINKRGISPFWNFGQNEDIPLLLILSSKMTHVWNYLGICPCFKLDFLKIEFQLKNNNNKSCMELKFHVGFFKKLDFRQIQFQNRDISLNNFRQRAFCWKVLAKWVFYHFGPGLISASSNTNHFWFPFFPC